MTRGWWRRIWVAASLSAITFFAVKVLAVTLTPYAWDLSNPASYSYSPSLIDVSGGTAQLKPQSFTRTENADTGAQAFSPSRENLYWATDHLELLPQREVDAATSGLSALYHLNEGSGSQMSANSAGTVPVSETPWQSNAYGTLSTSFAAPYTMGYNFTPQTNGTVSRLCGLLFTAGDYNVRLWNGGTQLASVSVTSDGTNWACTTITPVDVSAGTTYTVAVYIPSGAHPTHSSLSPALPQTFGNIRIETSVVCYGNCRPTTGDTTNMYGEADVVFNTFAPVGPATLGATTGANSDDPTWTQGLFGTQALSFDGGDFAWVADHQGLRPTANMTLEAWIKPATVASTREIVFKANSAAGGANPAYALTQTADTVSFRLQDGTGAIASASWTGLKAGTWYHLAGVFDDVTTNTITLYVNGQRVGGPNAAAFSLNHGLTPFYLGQRGDATSRFQGIIEEVGVYSRALSELEVKQHATFGPSGLYTSNPINVTVPPFQQTLTWDEGLVPLGEPLASSLPGLVALYHLDANATDAAGGDNNGTPTSANFTPGRFNSHALSCDGVNTYVSVSDASVLKPTTSITVEGWVKPFTTVGSHYIVFKANSEGAAFPAYALYQNGTDALFTIDPLGQPPMSAQWSGLQAGQWYHLVGTFDDTSDAIALYVNGGLSQSNVASYSLNHTSSSLYLGQQGNSGNRFSGLIEEVAIYNNQVLSAADVKRHYQQGVMDLRFQSRSGSTATPDSSWTEWRPSQTPAEISRFTYGLTGLWHVNEGTGTAASDTLGGTNTSADTGTLNGPVWAAGKLGNALSFDGTNDFVDIPDSASLSPTQALTVEAWIRPTMLGSGRALMTKWNSGAATTFYLQLQATDELRCSVATASTEAGTGSTYGETQNANLSPSIWSHVAMVFDGSLAGNANRLKLYLNGVQQTMSFAGTIPNALQDTAASLRLGGNAASGYFSGLMDEVAFYNVALDAATIREHYMDGSGFGYFTALPSVYSVVADLKQYTQIRAFFSAIHPATNVLLRSLTLTADSYSTTEPTLINQAGPTYTVLGSFTQTPNPLPAGSGELVYQISPTGDPLDWYYYTGTQWQPVTVITQRNNAAQITANIATFPARFVDPAGTLFWKAFFISNGQQPVVLDDLAVGYDYATLTLTAPTLNATWLVGKPYTIQWTKTGTIQNVKLEYDPDGDFDPSDTGAQATVVIHPNALNGTNPDSGGCTVTDLSTQGCYQWVIDPAIFPVSSPTSDPGTGPSRIRITGTDPEATHITNQSNPFVVSRLDLTSPPANATWLVGNPYTITWDTSATDPARQVTLEYAADGTTFAAIGTALATAGSLSWTPSTPSSPISDPNTGVSRLRISYVDAPSEFRQSPLFVVSRLDLTSPAGDTWLAGKTYPVTWVTSAGAEVSVKLEYSAKGDFTDTVAVIGSTPNDGSHDWLIDPATFAVSTDSNPGSGTSRLRISYLAAPSELRQSASFTVTRFEVTLPPLDAQWRMGKTHMIEWQTTATSVTAVRIEYSPDQGATWLAPPVASNAPHTGPTSSYDWPIPGSDLSYLSCDITDPALCPSPGGLIRVSVVEPPGFGVLNNASVPFSVTRPFLRILEPHAGEVLGVQTVKDIEWEKEGQIGSNLRIEYSTNGFADETQTTVIVDGDNGGASPVGSACSPTTFCHTWVVPDAAASPTVRIRITDLELPEGFGISEQFKVAGSISIASPVTGLTWAVGKAHTIQWTTKGQVNNVKIELSKDGGAIFDVLRDAGGNPIAASVPNGLGGGSFTWTPIAGDAATNAVIRISDAADYDVKKDSGVFAVTRLGVQSPAGGERWLVGTSQTLSWTHIGVGNVRLEYSTDDGATFPYVIAASAPATGATPAGACSPPAGGGCLQWSVPDTIKRNAVRIRIQDADQTGEAQAQAISQAFSIYGQLAITEPPPPPPSSTGLAWNSGQPHTITWNTPVGTIPEVSLVYSLDNFSTAPTPIDPNPFTSQVEPIPNGPNGCTVPLGNTGCFVWTPDFTAGDVVKLRVSDFQDSLTFSTSGFFEVPGIAMEVPAGGEVWPVGSDQTIKWTSTGDFTQVRLEYSTDDFVSSAVIVDPYLNTGNYLWTNLPDAISTNAKIRVTPTTDPSLFSTSNPFTITGVLTVTSPGEVAGQVFDAGSDVPMTWTTVGTIPTVSLEYSTDGATWAAVLNGAGSPATNIANTNTFTWRVPQTISTQVKVRVTDAVAGHPPTSDASDNLFTIRAAFGFLEPTASSAWGVYQSPGQPDPIPPITWTTQGSVSQVRLEYSTDDFATTPTLIGVVPNTGTYDWTVPDLISPMILAGGDTPGNGVPNHTRPVKIRIADADADHPAASATSSAFTVKWFKVTFEILDEDNLQQLNGLSVSDRNLDPAAPHWAWLVEDGSLNPAIYHHYAYGNYETTWWNANYFTKSASWTGNRDATGTLAYDKKVTVRLLSKLAEQVPYQVRVEYAYEPATDALKFKTWLEKRGLLVGTTASDLSNLGEGKVEVYSGTTLLTTLTQAAADANGTYDMTWAPTGLAAGNVYFAKASVVFPISTTSPPGTWRTSGGGVNVSIPKQIEAIDASSTGVTLTELQTELAPIDTKVTEIHTETVGPTSTLGQAAATVGTLPGQITSAQTAIQSDIATSTATLGGKVDGVQAYLADPSAGLPAIQQQLTNVYDQTKAMRRGGILNRDMELEAGESATIQYRSEGGVPTLNLFDGTGAPVAVPPLLLNGATGLYESTFSLASLGEYRAVVSEPASANSAGTLDSVALTVRAPVATAQDVTNITTLLNNLDAQMATLDTNLTSLMATAAAIQATTDATKTIADQLALDTQALLGKWGALDAALLMNELTALAGKLGTPPLGSSIAGELATIRAKTDTITWADVTAAKLAADNAKLAADTAASEAGAAKLAADAAQLAASNAEASAAAVLAEIGVGNIAAIKTATDTIDWNDVTTLVTRTGAIQAKTDPIDWTQVTAIKTATDTIAWSDVTGIDTKLGVVPLGSSLYDEMAKDATVSKDADLQTALTQVGTLQAALSALSTKVNDPAQKLRLEDAMTLLQSIRDNMPAGATDVSAIISQLTAVQTSLEAVPTGDVDLSAVATQLTGVEATLAALQSTQPERDTLMAKLDELQEIVTSAQDSSAAVGFSQNAYAAASEAVKILQQLQTEIRTHGSSPGAAALLSAFGDQMGAVSQRLSVTVIPGSLDTKALSDQVAEMAERIKALTTEKGYRFDSLFELTQTQATDVKTVRNRVEELKALVELQRVILEQKVNQPVMKTWFESQ